METKSRKRSYESINSITALPIKILIVDDNRLNQKIISHLLQDYDITIANNGQEAIDCYRASLNSQGTSDFEVILMDIEMPVKNGIEATKEIMALNQAQPVIGISSASDDLKQQALDAGMKICHSKPYQKQPLIDSIAQYTNHTAPTKKQASLTTNHLSFFATKENTPISVSYPTLNNQFVYA